MIPIMHEAEMSQGLFSHATLPRPNGDRSYPRIHNFIRAQEILRSHISLFNIHNGPEGISKTLIAATIPKKDQSMVMSLNCEHNDCINLLGGIG